MIINNFQYSVAHVTGCDLASLKYVYHKCGINFEFKDLPGHAASWDLVTFDELCQDLRMPGNTSNIMVRIYINCLCLYLNFFFK